jgi:hypothetical protein
VARTSGGRGPLHGVVAIAAALAACGAPGRGEPPAAGLGRAVFSGPARNLRASPDGAWLAFLDGCHEARGQFLPPQTANCDLRVIASSGGEARRVAAAVTTLPQGFAWGARSGLLAALSDYDYPAGSGALVLVRPPSAAPQPLGREVTFYAASEQEALGFVNGGQLWLAPPRGEPARVPGAIDVVTLEFPASAEPALQPGTGRPDAFTVLARRAAAAGGDLLAVAGGRPHTIGSRVTDYGFSAGGESYALLSAGGQGQDLAVGSARRGAAPRVMAHRVRTFAFSAAGAIAYLSDAVPGKQGDLHVLVSGGNAGPDRLLGREVGEFRWGARGAGIAWLEGYDARVRSGTLAVAGSDLAPRTVARNVSDFEIGGDGSRLAFLQHTTRGGYSVDLALARLDAPKEAPALVATGVFGFAFSPDGKWLYYRTRCTRNGEACDLERIPAGGLAPGAKPEPIAAQMKSFEFDPRDPGRLLVGFQRMDLQALDLAVWEKGKLVAVDQAALPGSAQFLGPDSRRLAYVVVHPKRAGVYVAQLP